MSIMFSCKYFPRHTHNAKMPLSVYPYKARRIHFISQTKSYIIQAAKHLLKQFLSHLTGRQLHFYYSAGTRALSR